ncbi:hypothetical protein PROFUN_08857 [Planoprotostelium fungivorum]|uniref:Uncharacterized protein n=1 Tax=Planoprotostelium fungivorum TaxID=1890364 RepID=A0A2P6NIY3_9EUKA|nr:hypothetical protein PROFUN_08857 [Planoprotostelium fungivorum]
MILSKELRDHIKDPAFKERRRGHFYRHSQGLLWNYLVPFDQNGCGLWPVLLWQSGKSGHLLQLAPSERGRRRDLIFQLYIRDLGQVLEQQPFRVSIACGDRDAQICPVTSYTSEDGFIKFHFNTKSAVVITCTLQDKDGHRLGEEWRSEELDFTRTPSGLDMRILQYLNHQKDSTLKDILNKSHKEHSDIMELFLSDCMRDLLGWKAFHFADNARVITKEDWYNLDDARREEWMGPADHPHDHIQERVPNDNILLWDVDMLAQLVAYARNRTAVVGATIQSTTPILRKLGVLTELCNH